MLMNFLIELFDRSKEELYLYFNRKITKKEFDKEIDKIFENNENIKEIKECSIVKL